MTVRSPSEISESIRGKLSTTLPGLSMEIGTIERKLIDAVSEAIAEASISGYTAGSILDLNTKVGLELEQFVGIFGFGRLQGRRATGFVRMETKTAATQPIVIQNGSKFQVVGGSVSGQPLDFVSIQTVTIPAGSFSVDIPVMCTVVGTAGNVPPGSITSASSSLGASSLTNLNPMTGGVDPETDEELRRRFRTTFLRNIAGTEDYYRALCLQVEGVNRVAVYGPTSNYRTQVEVSGSGSTTAIEISPDVKYIWKQSDILYKDLGTEDELFFDSGPDYVFSNALPPSFTKTDSGDLKPGMIVDVEFEYTTKSSRNDPERGITNKVDVFTDGTQPLLITEKTYISSQNFSTSSTSEIYTGKFYRRGTQQNPSSSSRFTRLGSTPFVSIPSSLTINEITYFEGVHYYVVNDNTLLRGTDRETSGLEWVSGQGPTSGTPFEISYTYNRIPEVLNTQLKSTKQVTTDVVVHEARYRYLDIFLTVEYDRGFSISVVNNAIQLRLRSFFANLSYGEWVEVSDIEAAVHGVEGVDNVWLTTDSESSKYGIRAYLDPESSTLLDNSTKDFKLGDDELPVFLNATMKRRANR